MNPKKVKSSKLKVQSSWILLSAILLLAGFLRLYKISEYMTFLGDEGRDVLIVKHLLEGDLVGLGPTASVGGFFTGPIYYYFMAPFLWLFRLDPVGPAVMVALFGVATVLVVYLMGKTFFNHQVGLFAAALYAVSPVIIAFSRSSWNPNPLPFFAILTIFLIYKSSERKSFRYLFSSGVLLGIALQLHYIATFLAASIGVYFLITQYGQVKSLIKSYVVLFCGFLVGYSPFLAFEATHGFPNTVTVVRFIFGSTNDTGFTGERFISIIGDVFFRLFGRTITRFPPVEQVTLGKDVFPITLYGGQIDIPLDLLFMTTVFLAIGSLIILVRQIVEVHKKKAIRFQAYILLLTWFAVGIFLFGFYRKPIYDYYFAFMFPLPFLLVGNFLAVLFDSFKNIGKVLSLTIFTALFLINFDGMPFRYAPNRQLEQVREISEFVLEKTDGAPFNFALITGGNSDHAYRYFFELVGNHPLAIENEMNDPERKTVTDQLLVICETPCSPLGHPLWEVAGFGRGEIVGEWTISVVKVYKLVHYEKE